MTDSDRTGAAAAEAIVGALLYVGGLAHAVALGFGLFNPPGDGRDNNRDDDA